MISIIFFTSLHFTLLHLTFYWRWDSFTIFLFWIENCFFLHLFLSNTTFINFLKYTFALFTQISIELFPIFFWWILLDFFHIIFTLLRWNFLTNRNTTQNIANFSQILFSYFLINLLASFFYFFQSKELDKMLLLRRHFAIH